MALTGWSILRVAGGGLVACAAGLLLLGGALVRCRRSLPGAGLRWCGALVMTSFSAAALALALGAAGLFSLVPAFGALAGLGIVAGGSVRGALDELEASLREALRIVTESLGGLGRLERLAAGAGGVVVALRCLRGLAAPPLAWDSLTYHLVRAGQAASGSGSLGAGWPGAPGYYGWFPPAGDALWSWFFLAVGDDAVVVVGGLLAWLSLATAFFVLCRSLGASRSGAARGTLGLVMLPAVAAFVTSLYPDTLGLGLVAHALVFVAAAGRLRSPACGGLALASAGLAGAVTIAGELWLLLVLVAVAILALGSGRRGWVLAMVPGVVMGAAPLVGNFALTGSPVYPFPVRAGSLLLVSGAPELEHMGEGPVLGDDHEILGWSELAATLLWRPYDVASEHVGLGLAAPVYAVLGLVALRGGVGRGGPGGAGGMVWGLLVLGALGVVASFLSPAASILRTSRWAPTVGRQLLPVLLPLLALVAVRESPFHATAAPLALGASVLLAPLRGVSSLGWMTLAQVAGDAAFALVVSWMVLRALGRLAGALRRWSWRRWLGPALWLVVFLVLLPMTRLRHRYEFYRAAGRGEAFDVHPLDARFAAAWPVWMRVDGARGVTLAVTAGWDGVGHNWYLYPLLGSRLQNVLRYVPTAGRGRIIDHSAEDERGRAADFWAWADGLVDGGIDAVVVLPPAPFERTWLDGHPLFFFRDDATPRDSETGIWWTRPALLHAVEARRARAKRRGP